MIHVHVAVERNIRSAAGKREEWDKRKRAVDEVKSHFISSFSFTTVHNGGPKVPEPILSDHR